MTENIAAIIILPTGALIVSAPVIYSVICPKWLKKNRSPGRAMIIVGIGLVFIYIGMMLL
jgi:hypothetical protein